MARDRARGLGRSSPEAVVQAWEDCLSSQPTCEEAACALVRLYSALGRRPSARATYRRCRAALEDLGLAGSPALEEAHAVALPPVPAVVALAAPVSSDHSREELRLVSVLCAELSVPYGGGTGPEELKELLSGALANLITQVEAFGGTVASVSGAGVEAVFGAPMAHEDDPERAIRATHRVQSDRGCADGGMTIRIGIETGPAVVGPSRPGYAAVGEVSGTAALLASVAMDASVLVARPPGPPSRPSLTGGRTKKRPGALPSPLWPVTSNVPKPGPGPQGATWPGRPRWWAGGRSWRSWTMH